MSQAAMGDRGVKYYDDLRKGAWKGTEHVTPSNRTRFRHVLKLLKKHRAGGALLDVGCGAGSLLRLAAQSGGFTSLAGSDFSDEALKLAREFLNCDLFTGDLTKREDFGDRKYDAIVCSEVLEHIEDLDASTRTIVDLLNPGGIAVISVPWGMKHWSNTDVFAGHVRRFEPGVLDQAVQAAGGDVIDQYIWGRLVFALYGDMFLNRVDQGKLLDISSRPKRWLKTIASQILYRVFMIDDLFVNSAAGRRLFSVIHKPEAAASTSADGEQTLPLNDDMRQTRQ